MDFQQLRAFVAVADAGGFSAAAGTLNLTQSAVSAQVRRLEEHLDARLFDRTSRSVALTEAGGMLLPYARRIIYMDEVAESAVGESQTRPALRFGITEEMAARYLADLLAAFARQYPDTRVEIVCDASTDMVELLQNGLLDLALTIRHAPESTAENLDTEELVWVAAEAFALRSEDAVPLACYPEGCIYRARAMEVLGRAGRRWTVRYTSQSPAGINGALAAGRAVTVKARRSIPPGCRVLGAAEGLPELAPVTVELHRAPTAVSPECEAFAGMLKEHVAAPPAVSADEPS